MFAASMSRGICNSYLAPITPVRATALNPKAFPSYPFQHSGSVLVCGNAFCLHDDLARAPNLPIIAVNGASGEIKADFLYTKHPIRFVERGYEWIGRQRKFHENFTVHGSKFHENMPHVQYWWEGARGGGGSGWGARKLSTLLGFDSVILCGMPLDPGGYASGRLSKLMNKPDVIDGYRREIEADTEWHEGVLSMSGWTAQILGSPC